VLTEYRRAVEPCITLSDCVDINSPGGSTYVDSFSRQTAPHGAPVDDVTDTPSLRLQRYDSTAAAQVIGRFTWRSYLDPGTGEQRIVMSVCLCWCVRGTGARWTVSKARCQLYDVTTSSPAVTVVDQLQRLLHSLAVQTLRLPPGQPQCTGQVGRASCCQATPPPPAAAAAAARWWSRSSSSSWWWGGGIARSTQQH